MKNNKELENKIEIKKLNKNLDAGKIEKFDRSQECG